jgi:thiosulfate/3-mercaptopyruvate sulfurtransferase
MAFTTLIDTQMLAEHLDDPGFAVLDCRFKLEDPASGEREYAARHIRGAMFVDLERDLSGPKTGANGRHPLPDAAVVAQTFSRLGVDAHTQVVAYDQDVGAFASRLWWMLRWMGHEKVAVLDGGFTKWLAEKRPTASGREVRTPRLFSGTPQAAMTANVQEVAALVDQRGWRLVDARAPERFRGETETIDKKAGHIPGAVDHFYKWNVGDDNTFRSPEALRDRLTQTLGDLPPERVVCYCGSGVTACHNLLALEHAGLRGARLYPGSWSEWSSDPARPVETKEKGRSR